MDQQHAARLHAQGVELGDQLGWGDRLGGHEGIISQPHQSRNSGGAQNAGLSKSRKPCRAIGEEPSLPFQRENRAPEGERFGASTAALPLWKPQTPKSGRDLWKSWRKTPTAAPSLWNERELWFPAEEVALDVRQERYRQVRRLISAPVVEPESVAETVASSHSPSGLHRGFRTHRPSLASAQRSAPSRRLISTAQRSPKVRLAMATYWPSGERD